jgi:predicted RecA/RadA family phage recombinase
MSQDFQARFIQEGDAVDHTPSSAVAAGAVVVVGAHVGITKNPIPANTLGALAIEGLFDVVKVTGAINDGAAVFWDADGNPLNGTAGTGCATTVSGGNTFMGFAVGAAAETAETVRIDLIGVAAVTNTIHNALTAVIEDPGNAGAIPVADSGHVDIVSGAAETRTLAAPASIGELLLLSMKTDGGDCVIAIATGINQTGNNRITMNDAGDSILLVGIASGANKLWRVAYNDGCTLSTV